MVKKFLILFWLLFSLIGFFKTASAMGIGVSPTVLNLATDSGGLITTEIIISNPSLEPGLFTVTADDYSDWFVFEPSELRLETKEQQKVKILIKPNKLGRFASNLSILAYPLDTRSFKAASGVKVPFNLAVETLQVAEWYYHLGWGLLFLAAAGVIGLIYYHQLKTSWWKKVLKNMRLI